MKRKPIITIILSISLCLVIASLICVAALQISDKYNLFIDGVFLKGLPEKVTPNELLDILPENSKINSTGNYIGTGTVITISEKEYTVVILGDVDGNGEVDSTDYLRIKQHCLGSFTLSDVAFSAADVYKSNEIDSTDYLRIKGHFIGTFDIYKDALIPEESFTITYNIAGSDTYLSGMNIINPNPTSYTSQSGTINLIDLEAPKGYEFLGWYTAPKAAGGERITEITKDSQGNKTFYAHWNIIEYNIIYDFGPGKNADTNVKTYTVKDTVFLSDAVLSGYLCTGWYDQTGTKITKISQGTTGDIVLTARWQSFRNLAHPIDTISNPLFEREIKEQIGDEYVFIYYLGYIDNVPLSWDGTFYHHNGSQDYSKEHSTTHETSDSTTSTVETITENTRGWESSVNVSYEVSFGTVAENKISAEVAHVQHGESTTVKSEGTATTITTTYVESSSDNANITVENSPVGWYRYVNFATIDVFATITYDAMEEKYYVQTVNLVRGISPVWDYSMKSASFDDDTNPILPFTVPKSFYNFIDTLTTQTEGLIISTNGSTCTVEGYEGKESSVYIPKYYKQNDSEIFKVVGLGSEVFSGNTNVTEVTIGGYIIEIPDRAFYGCTSLKTVYFNGKVSSIGYEAFSGCSNLNIALPEDLLQLGDRAFVGCEKIDEITLPPALGLGEQVFSQCGKLKIFASPDNVACINNVINSGATDIDLNLENLIEEGNTIEIGSLEVATSLESLILTGVQGKKYGLSLEANVLQATLKNIYMNGLCNITSDSLSLIETTIDNNLRFNGSSLFLRGTVTFKAFDSDSASLKISPIAGNKAKLISNGGIFVNGELILSGYMDGEIKGSVGRNGINTTNLIVNISGSLNIQGGNGNDGKNGLSYDRLKNQYGNACDGRHGGDGYNGEKGKESILCDTLTIINPEKLSLTLTSGNGGRGGDGGNGEFAGYDKNPTARAGDGGDGGRGGDGGTFISANEYIISGKLKSLSLNAGSGGDGGDGGDGGHADRNGLGYKYSYPGSGGSGGEGGKAGSLEIDSSLSSENIVSNTGTNGSAGSGGERGKDDWNAW